MPPFAIAANRLERMTPGRYELTATRGGVEVFWQGFDDRSEAYAALGEALEHFPDCEIRLTLGDTVLLSAGPARTSGGTFGPKTSASE